MHDARTSSRKFRRVGLYGPFGWGNLGDASIQEAMMHNLRRRCPDAEFVGISLRPENTLELHGIESVAIAAPWREARRPAPAAGGGSPAPSTSQSANGGRSWRERIPGWMLAPLVQLRFCLRARAFLRTLDVLIISGGGQLSDDWGGPWEHPLSMLRWVSCARWAGTEVLVVSVGAGPFVRRPTPLLLRWMLQLTEYRSYRDERSYQLVRAWDFTWRDRVVPDLAFSLPQRRREAARSGGLRVGLSPMSYCYPRAGAWPQLDRRRYERYRAVLKELAERLLARGHEVVLLNSNLGSDSSVFAELREDLLDADGNLPAGLLAEPTRGLEHLLQQILDIDVLITSRLHGVILSYVHGRAAIALSYDPKIEAVMEQFGQSDYSMPIETADADEVLASLERLGSDLDRTRAAIAARAAAHRAALDVQYDRLFGEVAAHD